MSPLSYPLFELPCACSGSPEYFFRNLSGVSFAPPSPHPSCEHHKPTNPSQIFFDFAYPSTADTPSMTNKAELIPFILAHFEHLLPACPEGGLTPSSFAPFEVPRPCTLSRKEGVRSKRTSRECLSAEIFSAARMLTPRLRQNFIFFVILRPRCSEIGLVFLQCPCPFFALPRKSFPFPSPAPCPTPVKKKAKEPQGALFLKLAILNHNILTSNRRSLFPFSICSTCALLDMCHLLSPGSFTYQLSPFQSAQPPQLRCHSIFIFSNPRCFRFSPTGEKSLLGGLMA